MHDIGYYGQFEGLKTAGLDKVRDKKEVHMVVGAQMASSFLNSDEIKKYLTPEQIKRIVHSVSVHDKIERLKDLDELVLMEADSLGAIDLSFVEPTYKGKEALDYLDKNSVRRRGRFITPEAMIAYDDLSEKFCEFIRKRDF